MRNFQLTLVALQLKASLDHLLMLAQSPASAMIITTIISELNKDLDKNVSYRIFLCYNTQ